MHCHIVAGHPDIFSDIPYQKYVKYFLGGDILYQGRRETRRRKGRE